MGKGISVWTVFCLFLILFISIIDIVVYIGVPYRSPKVDEEIDTVLDSLLSDRYDEIEIEVDYVENLKPSFHSMEVVENFIKENFNKKIDIKFSDYIPLSDWDNYSSLQGVERNYRDFYGGDSVISLYILSIKGTVKDAEDALGVTYTPSKHNIKIYIHTEMINLYAEILGKTPAERINLETNVMLHEFIHFLELFKDKLGKTNEDPEHPNHCINKDCVMFWQANTTDWYVQKELGPECMDVVEAKIGSFGLTEDEAEIIDKTYIASFFLIIFLLGSIAFIEIGRRVVGVIPTEKTKYRLPDESYLIKQSLDDPFLRHNCHNSKCLSSIKSIMVTNIIRDNKKSKKYSIGCGICNYQFTYDYFGWVRRNKITCIECKENLVFSVSEYDLEKNIMEYKVRDNNDVLDEIRYILGKEKNNKIITRKGILTSLNFILHSAGAPVDISKLAVFKIDLTKTDLDFYNNYIDLKKSLDKYIRTIEVNNKDTLEENIQKLMDKLIYYLNQKYPEKKYFQVTMAKTSFNYNNINNYEIKFNIELKNLYMTYLMKKNDIDVNNSLMKITNVENIKEKGGHGEDIIIGMIGNFEISDVEQEFKYYHNLIYREYNPKWLLIKAMDYFDKNRYDESIDYCNKSLEINPDNNACKLQFIKALYHKKELEYAENLIKVYIEKNPVDVEALKYGVMINQSLGEYVKFEKYINKALKIDNRNREIKQIKKNWERKKNEKKIIR